MVFYSKKKSVGSDRILRNFFDSGIALTRVWVLPRTGILFMLLELLLSSNFCIIISCLFLLLELLLFSNFVSYFRDY